MKIDLSLGQVHLKTIKGMIEHREYEDVGELVGDMANATQCHIIICIYYTMHFAGRTPKLEKSLATCMEFYRIKEIIGWPLVIKEGMI